MNRLRADSFGNGPEQQLAQERRVSRAKDDVMAGLGGGNNGVRYVERIDRLLLWYLPR